MMIKSVASILGYKAELFTADQTRQLCAHLKLTGFRSKSKDEALRIIAVSKIHSELYNATGITGDGAEKQPAKTKNCIFRLINVLFSDEMSASWGRGKTRMHWTVDWQHMMSFFGKKFMTSTRFLLHPIMILPLKMQCLIASILL
jgi:hypothetical protein